MHVAPALKLRLTRVASCNLGRSETFSSLFKTLSPSLRTLVNNHKSIAVPNSRCSLPDLPTHPPTYQRHKPTRDDLPTARPRAWHSTLHSPRFSNPTTRRHGRRLGPIPQIIDNVDESSIHSILHKLAPKFKHGIFSKDRNAIEQVHSENPPLATSLLSLARRQSNATASSLSSAASSLTSVENSLSSAAASDTGSRCSIREQPRSFS